MTVSLRTFRLNKIGVLPLVGFSLWAITLKAHAQVLPPPLQDLTAPAEHVQQQVEDRVLQQVEDSVTFAQQQIPIREVNAELTDISRRVISSVNGAPLFTEVVLPTGERAIEHEWLVLADDNVVAALARLDATVLKQQNLPYLDMQLVRFRVPAALDSAEQLKAQLPASAHTSLSRHFIYDAQGDNQTTVGDEEHAKLRQDTWCDAPVKIGMVDTEVLLSHPAFAHQPVRQRHFSEQQMQRPTAHGTAVAGLLVAKQEGFKSLVPQARLYNAAVFYRHDDLHQGAALISLLEGLDWLVSEGVRVINLSLTGPENPLLAKAVAQLNRDNIVVVAAAGNEGPLAPPAFPAAYDEVIAVSAVDDKANSYRWANRGDYIDFASLGVHVVTARRDGAMGYETGTSMAAPVVTAAAACLWHQQPDKAVAEVYRALQAEAIDWGEQGHDPVFGHGLMTPKSSH